MSFNSASLPLNEYVTDSASVRLDDLLSRLKRSSSFFADESCLRRSSSDFIAATLFALFNSVIFASCSF